MNAGCPYCAGKKPLPGVTDLKTVYPEIAQEWDYANNESSPEQYMPKSNKVVSWICPICKESYRRKVIERTGKGFGCKNCMGETHTSRQEQSLIYYLSQVINVENRAKRLDKELDVYNLKHFLGCFVRQARRLRANANAGGLVGRVALNAPRGRESGGLGQSALPFCWLRAICQIAPTAGPRW